MVDDFDISENFLYNQTKEEIKEIIRMNFKELNLRAPDPEFRKIKLNSGVELNVRAYLPIDAKADLITWVINMALDDKTGSISPIRFEACFSIAVVQRYCGIEIPEDSVLSETYDLLETNDVIAQVMGVIPEDEITFLKELALDTVADISRYTSSFAGVMSTLNTDTSELTQRLQEIMQSIKNNEGMEQLAAIKDMVGTD